MLFHEGLCRGHHEQFSANIFYSRCSDNEADGGLSQTRREDDHRIFHECRCGNGQLILAFFNMVRENKGVGEVVHSSLQIGKPGAATDEPLECFI